MDRSRRHLQGKGKRKKSNAVSSRSNDKLFNDFESSNKMCLCLGFVQHAMEDGNELLSNGEAEDQLGSDLYNPISCQKTANFLLCMNTYHKDLGSQSLEETTETFLLDEILDNVQSRLGVLKVTVLNTGLDDIKRSSDGDRSDSTANGGAEVLEEGSLVVVLETKDVFLDKGGTTEERKGARGVTGSRPASTTVQTLLVEVLAHHHSMSPSRDLPVQAHAFILDDGEETTATESFRVGLALNLQDVERQKSNFTNADQADLGNTSKQNIHRYFR